MNLSEKIEPVSMCKSVLSKVEKYNPEILTEKSDFVEIKIANDSNEELWIELSHEFTIFFGDWHEHFFPYQDEYEAFLDDLSGILENRKFTICSYSGKYESFLDDLLKISEDKQFTICSCPDDQWCCSSLSQRDKPDFEEIRRDYGENKIIKCNYWDGSKNIVFKT